VWYFMHLFYDWVCTEKTICGKSDFKPKFGFSLLAYSNQSFIDRKALMLTFINDRKSTINWYSFINGFPLTHVEKFLIIFKFFPCRNFWYEIPSTQLSIRKNKKQKKVSRSFIKAFFLKSNPSGKF
jgi:hypothetical protein